MQRSSLCDYSGAYIIVKQNISVKNTTAQGAAANNTIVYSGISQIFV